MEPAAMLVRTFEIDVGRERNEAGPERRQDVMHGAGVEPHVHHVGALLVDERFVAQEVTRVQREPGLDAALGDELGDLLEQFRRLRVRLARFPVHEHRERHAPGTLARDAPVGARLDHAGDALLAPAGNPLHAADRVERVAAQPGLLHAQEPLRRRAENHRRLVAPAIRVAVPDLLGVDEATGVAQCLDDLRVRVPDRQALEQRRAGDETPVVAHRVVDRQVVAAAHLVVVGAVAGRRVHGTGARIERHVVAEDDRHLALVERVLEAQSLERPACHLAEHAMRARADARSEGREQRLGHDQALRAAVAVELGEHVVIHRVQGDRLVCGQRPGRRGPDGDGRAQQVVRRESEAPRGVVCVGNLEPHVDCGRGALLVLDFRLCERRAAVEAPVHGLEAPHQVAATDDRGKGAQLLRLEARGHGDVGIVPVAHHAEALEIDALDVDLGRRIFAAGLAERIGVELLADPAMLLLDLLLDRQAVAVPSRHVGRVESIERAGLDDDVFQDLVDGMTEVDHAIRVRAGHPPARTSAGRPRGGAARGTRRSTASAQRAPARGARGHPSSGRRCPAG